MDTKEDLSFLTSLGNSFSEVLAPAVEEICGQDVYEVISDFLDGPVTPQAVYGLVPDSTLSLARGFNDYFETDLISAELVEAPVSLTRERWV